MRASIELDIVSRLDLVMHRSLLSQPRLLLLIRNAKLVLLGCLAGVAQHGPSVGLVGC